MHQPRHEHPRLTLRPVSGPPGVRATPVGADHSVLGRGLDCQVVLPHETVSRRHAALSRRGRDWFVQDLGSRHGTLVNGAPLSSTAPAALEAGDQLTIGPWVLAVEIEGRPTAGRSTGMTLVTPVPETKGTQRVERVSERELGWSAQQRLDLLLRVSSDIHAAPTEADLHRIALEAARAGSGYERAAWLRPLGDAGGVVEVAAALQPKAEAPSAFAFSQSLIREAAAGQMARLTDQAAPANYAHSIASLGITSALCAPVMVGSSPAAFLYLDARAQESPVNAHAPGFVLALSQICGLALANIRRADLEARQRRLETDLAAAREAQELILPPPAGTHGTVRYALRTTPGRTVAGDLFDVVPLDDGRVAVVIGDVAGKAMSAALLMASTQAYLHAALARYGDAARALSALNHYLHQRCPMDRFVTMWVGVIDPRAGTVVHVDAGHGHWLVRRQGRAPELVRTGGGIPVGIDPDYEYRAEVLELGAGDRILLFSDGVLDQRSPAGDPFGLERVTATLAESPGPQDDVDRLFKAVELHAGSMRWDDDATAASVELGRVE